MLALDSVCSYGFSLVCIVAFKHSREKSYEESSRRRNTVWICNETNWNASTTSDLSEKGDEITKNSSSKATMMFLPTHESYVDPMYRNIPKHLLEIIVKISTSLNRSFNFFSLLLQRSRFLFKVRQTSLLRTRRYLKRTTFERRESGNQFYSRQNWIDIWARRENYHEKFFPNAESEWERERDKQRWWQRMNQVFLKIKDSNEDWTLTRKRDAFHLMWKIVSSRPA